MPVPAFLSSVLSSIIGSAVDNAIENALNAPLPPPDPASVWARPFPDGTLRGEMEPMTGLGQVTISGVTYTRAPGMQIRNERNMIVIPTAIQSTVPVRFRLDTMGNVFRVWIMTPAEIAAP